MMEHNPDLIDRQIQDRQEAIRDGFAVSNGQRGMHPLRIAIGMAIIRAGEAVRGGRLERPVEVFRRSTPCSPAAPWTQASTPAGVRADHDRSSHR